MTLLLGVELQVQAAVASMIETSEAAGVGVEATSGTHLQGVGLSGSTIRGIFIFFGLIWVGVGAHLLRQMLTHEGANGTRAPIDDGL